ncbi:aminotransferase-like domain-containing protein [Anaerotignum sp.]|uniref:aminotransferase-like domain-containing protein n=1 Tax=Anaerotignum sp. TaxID=2039241 RepID=UPI002714D4E9|nr:PLP-dependent aminotransferase family protein [Anaerotignum sp.]
MPVNSFTDYPMSWKPEKTKLSSPLYLSLAKLLEHDIKNGSLAPHTKLPPQRELADYLDINLSTVTKAFKLCQLNGFLYAVIGRGTFVSPNAGVSISIQDTKTNNALVEMGIIKPLDSLNQYTEEAIKTILSKNPTTSLLDYSAPFGSPYQKNAAQKWLAQYGLHSHRDDIFFTTGGQNAFAVVLVTLFHHGDKIATDHFTYSNFIELANMLNIKLVPIQADEKGMLPEDLEMQCRLQGIQGVYLVPTYNNPTGTLMDTPRKETLAKVIKKHHLILIEDDIYAFLSPQGYTPVSALCPQEGCYIASLSKAICPGLRVAILSVPHRLSALIARGIFNINVKTSSINVETAAYMIQNDIAQEVVSKKRKEAFNRNLIFERYFPNETPTPLSFSRWLPLAPALYDLPMERLALEKGLRLFHSNRFLVGTPSKEQFLRIAISSANTTEELEYGLEKLKNLLIEDERRIADFPIII